MSKSRKSKTSKQKQARVAASSSKSIVKYGKSSGTKGPTGGNASSFGGVQIVSSKGGGSNKAVVGGQHQHRGLGNNKRGMQQKSLKTPLSENPKTKAEKKQDQSERADFDRELESMQERVRAAEDRQAYTKQQQRKKASSNGKKEDTLFAAASATFHLEPQSMEELVDDTARRVVHTSFFHRPQIPAEQASTPPVKNSLLQVMASAQQHDWQTQPQKASPTMSSTNAFSALQDDSDDEAVTPPQQLFQLAAPSFILPNANKEQNDHFNTPWNTPLKNPVDGDDIDPDL
eukprot:scaffold334816_cov59-Attheya_sp.AAC.2